MTDYCTPDEVKLYLGVSGSADDALIGSLITAVSRAFDQATGYTFGATVDTTRYYWCYLGDIENNVIYLDQPFSSITSITNGDGVLIAATDYRLLPRDIPYTTATLKPNSTIYFTDGDDYDGVAVVGVVGYPLTNDIRQACVLWAGFMHWQKDNPLIDLTAIEAGAVISTPNRPQYTRDVINNYRDRRPSG